MLAQRAQLLVQFADDREDGQKQSAVAELLPNLPTTLSIPLSATSSGPESPTAIARRAELRALLRTMSDTDSVFLLSPDIANTASQDDSKPGPDDADGNNFAAPTTSEAQNATASRQERVNPSDEGKTGNEGVGQTTTASPPHTLSERKHPPIPKQKRMQHPPIPSSKKHPPIPQKPEKKPQHPPIPSRRKADATHKIGSISETHEKEGSTPLSLDPGIKRWAAMVQQADGIIAEAERRLSG